MCITLKLKYITKDRILCKISLCVFVVVAYDLKNKAAATITNSLRIADNMLFNVFFCTHHDD